MRVAFVSFARLDMLISFGRVKNTHDAPWSAATMTPNVRHERRAKGREAAFGTSVRWSNCVRSQAVF